MIDIGYFGRKTHAWKVALHLHSTRSDGALPPGETFALYERLGYDVCCLTDHHRPAPVSEWSSAMLLMGGMEFHPAGPRGTTWHLVAAGVPEDFPDPSALTAQEGVDRVLAAGGLCHVAHPAWSEIRSSDIEGLRGVCGVEVFNGGVMEVERGFSCQTLTELWAEGGDQLPLAVDDLHHEARAGLGWTMVISDRRDAASMLEAIRAGRAYASTGPDFLSFEREGDALRVRFTPCERVALNMPRSRVYRMPPPYLDDVNRGVRKTYEEVTVDLGKLRADDYVQFQIVDAAGRHAWSAPFRNLAGQGAAG